MWLIFSMDTAYLGKGQIPNFDTKARYILVFISSIALSTLQFSSILPTYLTHAYTLSFIWHCSYYKSLFTLFHTF